MNLSPAQTPRSTRQGVGFTLVEIMIVVLIIGILLAIAVPNFVAARESSRAKACVGNLAQINSAKMQCSMDNKLAQTSTATFSVDGVTPTTPGPNGNYQLVNIGSALSYMRGAPVCPSGGAYAPGTVSNSPTCSVSTSTASTDYQVGGKWYHGY